MWGIRPLLGSGIGPLSSTVDYDPNLPFLPPTSVLSGCLQDLRDTELTHRGFPVGRDPVAKSRPPDSSLDGLPLLLSPPRAGPKHPDPRQEPTSDQSQRPVEPPRTRHCDVSRAGGRTSRWGWHRGPQVRLVRPVEDGGQRRELGRRRQTGVYDRTGSPTSSGRRREGL